MAYAKREYSLVIGVCANFTFGLSEQVRRLVRFSVCVIVRGLRSNFFRRLPSAVRQDTLRGKGVRWIRL